MKAQSQGGDPKEKKFTDLIKRLKELRPLHISPYNLGDGGEIGGIIDKLTVCESDEDWKPAFITTWGTNNERIIPWIEENVLLLPQPPIHSKGVALIAQERKEQIEKHGFDITEDDYYDNGELRNAALFSLTGNKKYYPERWQDWFSDNVKKKRKRMNPLKFQIEMLKIAGALIAAEIDRLQNNQP